MPTFLVCWVLGSILWMLISNLIEINVVKKRGLPEKTENEIPPVTLLSLLRWVLIWPLSIPVVLYAANKGKTIQELGESFASKVSLESPDANTSPGRQTKAPEWVTVKVKDKAKVKAHFLYYPVGGFLTHVCEEQNGKAVVKRIGIWLYPGQQIPINRDVPIVFKCDSFARAREWVEVEDDDFLYLCNPLRLEKLAQWHKENLS